MFVFFSWIANIRFVVAADDDELVAIVDTSEVCVGSFALITKLGD